MADLRGVLISLGDLGIATSYHMPSDFPMFTEDDASPLGKYHYVFLDKGLVQEDKKELILRPTGPNDSGPYFHSILSGGYGVRAAASARRCYPDTGPYYPVIRRCNYSSEFYREDQWYKKVKYYRRLVCDGSTVVLYELQANEPGAYYRAHSALFCAYSVDPISHIPTDNNSVVIPHWTIDRSDDCSWATIDGIKQQFDYYLWDVLHFAGNGYIDPQLHESWSRMILGHGEPLSLSNGELAYSFGELTAFEWWGLTGCMEGRYRALAGQAYYNAATSLPKSACNSIANAIEAASTVKSLIKGDFKKLLPSNPKDAWLFYRYQYSTSKMDLEDYRTLTQRLLAVTALPVLRSDGSITDGHISSHVVIECDPSYLIPADTKQWLETYGFKLNATNVWDMIPYSFVVDWFFHIGRFISILEEEQWAYSLPVISAWTSFSTLGPGVQSNYFRVPGYFRANAPFLDYQERDTSGKTIVKRVLDSIALFL